MRTRAYVCLIEKFLKTLLARYDIPVVESPHIGTFVDANSKIASIGIQIRHRVTMHGFALNVEDSIQKWFANIVACGLTDVHATSMNQIRRLRGVHDDDLTVPAVVPLAVEEFGRQFDREMAPFDVGAASPLAQSIRRLFQPTAESAKTPPETSADASSKA